jgi:glycosyltransferase involved in cell wall biosynthesis
MAASLALGFWGLKRPDVIFAIQPPTVCTPAWFFSRLWQVPFVYDLEDMWPETLFATGMVSNARLLAMVGKYCNWAYKRASGIRIISKGFHSNLLGKGVASDNIYLIPNWVNTEFYSPRVLDSDLARRLGLTGGTNILYAGTIGLAQGLDTVLDAAVLIMDLPEVQFVLAGDGVDLARLKMRAKSLGLENVKFLGRQPTKMMPALYALSSMLLVHLKDDPLFRITIPHKTLTYLASGKPVLAAMEGDVADVIREAGAGLTCHSGDPEALAETVRKFCNMPSAQREKMGENGRKFACDYFGKDHVIDQICQMLYDIVRSTKSKRMLSII